MSDLQLIESTLKKAARRRLVNSLWRNLWLGLLLGGVLWLLILGAFKIFPLPAWWLTAGAVAAALTVLVTAVIMSWRRISLLETARWVDQRQQLQERLSTALELSSSTAGGEWKALIVSDAARCVTKVDVRCLLPFTLPRVARWSALVLVLGVGLGFVPEYRSQAFRQGQQDQANIKDTGKNLGELMRRNLEQRPPALEPTEKAMEAVAELGEQFAQASLTRGEALRDLTSLTDKLSQQAKELSANPALKPLEKAAREPGGSGSTSPQALQQQMDALQKALGDAAGKGDKLDRLQKELQKLKNAAANPPDKNSAAGAAARAQMAQTLADLAKEARDLGAALPGLEEAISALQADQSDLFVRDLDVALNDLEKMKQMAQALQELQQQAAKLGKDLAEQLAKGQAEAAQSTLKEMIEQLKSASVSKEQLEKILQDVSAAVSPANEYGKVAEHLRNATQQLQKGEKPDAAQSLAQAAKELENLMQQAADAQALDGALDALARAQLALSSGKRWSMTQGTPCAACNGLGCAQCKGQGWRHGGKPGSGVGTWADETGWSYFEQNSERVDNSGVARPDMDPRGVADRGEGKLNPNLLPDKVRGQMSPGGSMPSITLKGVSIRGQSSVAYQEAATAAQTDAQSALNQDQVPRPYQNAVRDYFDDLKK